MKAIFNSLNLTTAENLLEYIKNSMIYGWLDQNGQIHAGINDANNYCLQTPAELLQNKIGICWDITELCRAWFKNMTDLAIETYYIMYDDDAGCPSHTITVFHKDSKVFWFEPKLRGLQYSGIHEYDSMEKLLEDAVIHTLQFQQQYKILPSDIVLSRLHIHRYQTPPFHINGHQMRAYIDQSEKII